VVRIVMPPLRERKTTSRCLVRAFFAAIFQSEQQGSCRSNARTMNALQPTTGRVTSAKLRTASEHGVVMATDQNCAARIYLLLCDEAAGATLPRGEFPRLKGFGEKTSPLDLQRTEAQNLFTSVATTNGNALQPQKKLGISRARCNRQNQRNEKTEKKKEVAGKREIYLKRDDQLQTFPFTNPVLERFSKGW